MSTSAVHLPENEERSPITRKGGGYGFTVVRVVLGLLLIATAGLKLFDPSPDTLGGLELLSSPHWRLAAIYAEAALGVWLLIGSLPRLLWVGALVGFSLLASVSLYLAIDGQSSCGCFGAKLPVSPWYALGLDVAALAALIWQRPRRGDRTEAPYSAALRQVISVVAGAAVMLALAFGVLTWMYGSPYEGLLHARGDLIAVEPTVSYVGESSPGEHGVFNIQISNHRDRTITILGGTTTCSCITTKDLPITMPPNESRTIAVRINFRGTPGRFQHTFVLYTDDEIQHTLMAQFAGRVIESPGA